VVLKAAKRAALEAEYVEPMMVKPVRDLPKGDEWLYEVKWDGFRALALKHNSSVRLLSRNANDLSRHFPLVLKAIEGLAPKTILMDGEIVALDDQGHPSFQRLQNRSSLRRGRIFFYAFDLLNLNGQDLRWPPLEEHSTFIGLCEDKAAKRVGRDQV